MWEQYIKEFAPFYLDLLFDYLRALNAKHYNFTIEDVVVLSDLTDLFCPKV